MTRRSRTVGQSRSVLWDPGRLSPPPGHPPKRPKGPKERQKPNKRSRYPVPIMPDLTLPPVAQAQGGATSEYLGVPVRDTYQKRLPSALGLTQSSPSAPLGLPSGSPLCVCVCVCMFPGILYSIDRTRNETGAAPFGACRKRPERDPRPGGSFGSTGVCHGVRDRRERKETVRNMSDVLPLLTYCVPLGPWGVVSDPVRFAE